jgi:hypothetical protein
VEGKMKKELNNLVKKGYVLHGSPLKQKILKPTKQFDYRKKVLCFTNIPEVAFFHAITSHKRAGKSANSRYDLENMKFYATKNVLDTIDIGYIYAVKRDKLIHSKKRGRDWEWLSYHSVKPQKIIKASPKSIRLKISLLNK